MALRRKRAAAKKEENLEDLVKSGEEGAYTALQLYRSRALRYQSKGDVTAALNLTAQGACTYLEQSKATESNIGTSKALKTAGTELAMLLLTFLTDNQLSLDNATHALVTQVDDAFVNFCPDLRRVEYLKNCIKWAVTNGCTISGIHRLHQRHGESLWTAVDEMEDTPGAEKSQKEKDKDPYGNYYKAIYPFVAGKCNHNCLIYNIL